MKPRNENYVKPQSNGHEVVNKKKDRHKVSPLHNTYLQACLQPSISEKVTIKDNSKIF